MLFSLVRHRSEATTKAEPCTGTPTTVTATGRYKQFGKTVIAEMDVVITDKGTASGALIATVPVTAAVFRYVGNSFEYQTTGLSGGTLLNGPGTPTVCSSRDAAAGTYWVNGYRVAITITLRGVMNSHEPADRRSKKHLVERVHLVGAPHRFHCRINAVSNFLGCPGLIDRAKDTHPGL